MAMSTAEFRENILGDITFMGLRAAIGVIFIVHGVGKIGNQGFIGWMGSMGIGPEMAFIIAIGEIIPGILLLVGVLNRISATILAIIMTAAIFVIKNGEEGLMLTGDSAYEFDLVLLAGSLLIIVLGPGRISISHAIKKIPRFLH